MTEILESRRFGPVSDAQIVELEGTLGYGLPQDYRAFLLEHNGGKPGADTIDFEDERGPSSSDVNYLFGVHRGEYYASLPKRMEMFRGRIPAGFLPIGDDSGGNLWVLELEGPGRGRVYFWDHEGEADEGEPPTTRNMTVVAASFTDFLARLREFEDE